MTANLTNPLYQSLDKTVPEIRLFTLHASPSPNSPLQGELTTVALSSQDSYEALSYAWGEPEFTKSVTINGEKTLVTANLHAALRDLRLPDAPRRLWIDAICINQRSMSERSHQVTLMKEIYSRCEKDLLWLGHPWYRDGRDDSPSPDYTLMHRGLELMAQISKKDIRALKEMEDQWDDLMGSGWGVSRTETLRKARKEKATLRSAELGRVSPEDGDLPKEKMLHDLEVRELESVFTNPAVYSRLWVMQELAVAPRIELVAGHMTLDWECLSEFLGDSQYADAFHAVFGHDNVSSVVARMFERVQSIDHQRRIMADVKSGKGESKLLDVLARFRDRQASDPHDQIYGVLGMTTDAHDIVVDYSKSVQQVYMDVTRCIIDQAGHLDVLCQSPWMASRWFGQERAEPWAQELPSWTPNYHYRGEVLLFGQRSIYNAGRPSCEVPCQIIGGKALRTRGIQLGTVGEIRQDDYYSLNKKGTGNSTGQERFSRDIHKQPLALEWLELYLGLGPLESPGPEHMYVTGEPAFTAFWRTLVRDCAAYPMERLTPEQIDEADTTAREVLLDPGSYRTQRRRMFDTAFWLPEGKIGRLLRDLYFTWTFATTDSGLYMLIVPPTQTGDVVACLDGGKVPVVLRPVGEKRFQLISVAYVHGFMDMEAARDERLREKLGLEEQEFILV